jgi:prepilin-type N-terminal cleavage/methylation domain-containing protein
MTFSHVYSERECVPPPASLAVRLSSSRQGYTLLEVLLSAAIAVILLGGLYVAMRVQLRSAQDSRDVVEQGSLVRSLVARLASDMSGNLRAAPQPASGSGATSSGGSSTATSSGDSSTGSTTSTPSATNSGIAVAFNLGVQGDSSRVSLYVSRPVRPPSTTGVEAADAELQPGMCDLRRITYWMVLGSGTAGGLARQEVRTVTADDAMSALPPDVPDQESFIVAPEVKGLTFKYFDGTEWRDEWDGTAAGADGSTPLGPPAAIAFEMSVALPGATGERMIRHVVALQCANGPAQSSGSESAAGSSSTSR